VSTINRQPTGWLGFLGIKNFGRNPVMAPESLQPTWDLATLYLASSQEYITATLSVVNAIGNWPLLTVPNGEVWYVHSAAVFTQTGAGETFNGNLARISQSNLITCPLTAPIIQVGVSDLQNPIAGPFVLQSGESIGISAVAVIGTVNAIPFAVITRLSA